MPILCACDGVEKSDPARLDCVHCTEEVARSPPKNVMESEPGLDDLSLADLWKIVVKGEKYAKFFAELAATQLS